MSEQTTLAPEITDTPEATTPAAPKVNLLIIIALISLAAAAFFDFTGTLIRSIEYSYEGMLTSTFIGGIEWIMCGAILPISLFLIKDNTNRKKLSKLFMIVTLAFLAMQLFSAFFIVIYQLAGSKIFGIRLQNLGTMMYNISSSALFTPFSQLIKFNNIYYFFASCLESLASLLYIIPNAICLLGFLKTSK